MLIQKWDQWQEAEAKRRRAQTEAAERKANDQVAKWCVVEQEGGELEVVQGQNGPCGRDAVVEVEVEEDVEGSGCGCE